jgi:hypothetical protein
MVNYAFIKGNEVFSIITFDDPTPELLEQFKIYHEADEIVLTTNTYISVGDLYVDGKFSPPKPYPSWILDEETYCWIPPVAYPADELVYTWDEETLSWVQ